MANEPYRSIVELITPSSLDGMLFALEWLPETKTEMYKSTIDRLRTKFSINESKNKENSSLGHYVASIDVDWNKKPGVKKIDMSQEARAIAEKEGAFTAGSFGPKLGELYTLLAPFPLEYQNHLRAHTSLADALLLYELVQLGYLHF